jgi:L-ascorbate metabolism protein UlaG (beta-lactamase superfamily)
MFRLSPTVVLEPLVRNWYAGPLLVAPATSAAVTANAHVAILESYLAAPDVHARSSKNPKLLGGPFCDFGRDRTDEVHALLSSIRMEHRRLLDFADAISRLRDLVARADGMDLSPLYAEIPEALRGFIELSYDSCNNATFSLFEGLLYESDLYVEADQSILLTTTEREPRAFVGSTPRFPDDRDLQIAWSLKDPRLDRLAEMRVRPTSDDSIAELFDRPFAQVAHFFSEAGPAKAADPVSSITYVGHACLLFGFEGTHVLVDPLIPSRATSGERYSWEDLPAHIDAAVVTHAHQDHAVLETLLQLRSRLGCILIPRNTPGALQDPSLGQCLRRLGFQNVIEVDEFREVPIGPGVTVVGLPFLGEHGDLQINSKMTYAIRCGDTQSVCLADAANVDPQLFHRIAAFIGKVDRLFVGMESRGAPVSWMYGAVLPKQVTRQMAFARRLAGCGADAAAEIVEALSPDAVHIYAMGAEHWVGHITSLSADTSTTQLADVARFLELCRHDGRSASALVAPDTLSLRPE